MYGFVAEGEPVQLVTFRVEATGLVRKAELAAARRGRARTRRPRSSARARSGCPRRAASCPARSTTASGCAAGNRIAGPAIVEQMDATTVVLPGMIGRASTPIST